MHIAEDPEGDCIQTGGHRPREHVERVVVPAPRAQDEVVSRDGDAANPLGRHHVERVAGVILSRWGGEPVDQHQ